MNVEAKLNIKIQRSFTFRMAVLLCFWLLISVVIPLTFPETLEEKMYLFSFFVAINTIILIYRKYIIRLIKLKSKLELSNAKLIFKTLLFKKEIFISDIKMIGYRKSEKDTKTGDLIINLTAFKLDYLYLYNLVFNQTLLDESSSFKSFIVPDVENIEKIYNKILELKYIDKENFLKIGIQGNNELKKYRYFILIKNQNSEIIFCDEERFKILEFKKVLKVKEKKNFLSKGGIIMSDYKLPCMRYLKIQE